MTILGETLLSVFTLAETTPAVNRGWRSEPLKTLRGVWIATEIKLLALERLIPAKYRLQ